MELKDRMRSRSTRLPRRATVEGGGHVACASRGKLIWFSKQKSTPAVVAGHQPPQGLPSILQWISPDNTTIIYCQGYQACMVPSMHGTKHVRDVAPTQVVGADRHRDHTRHQAWAVRGYWRKLNRSAPVQRNFAARSGWVAGQSKKNSGRGWKCYAHVARVLCVLCVRVSAADGPGGRWGIYRLLRVPRASVL